MKISKQTLSILKNFAAINQSIVLEKGHEVSTVSHAGNIFARFKAPEDFPEEVPLYDLPEFLSALSLFQDSEQKFKKDHVVLSDGTQTLKYSYSESNVVTKAPKIAEEQLANPLGVFKLTHAELTNLIKAAPVCKADEIVFESKDRKVSLKAHSKSKPDLNNYAVGIGGQCDSDFEVRLSFDSFKMIEDDYEISLYDSFIRFNNETAGLEYIIATE